MGAAAPYWRRGCVYERSAKQSEEPSGGLARLACSQRRLLHRRYLESVRDRAYGLSGSW